MSSVRVIGVGNVDRGDDAVGPLTVAELQARGVDASFASLSGEPTGLVAAWRDAAAAIVVDAAAGGPVGRIRRLEADDPAIASEAAPTSSHAAGLAAALALSEALGATPPALALYLVSGVRFGIGDPLSPAVAAAIPVVADRIAAEIAALTMEAAADA